MYAVPKCTQHDRLMQLREDLSTLERSARDVITNMPMTHGVIWSDVRQEDIERLIRRLRIAADGLEDALKRRAA